MASNYGSMPVENQMSEGPKPRVNFCTSAEPHNVEAFISTCREKFLVYDIQYHQLPYNDVDNFKIDGREMDVLVLCHSINNRRFAITNVMDALYNKFLPNASKALGRGRVGVIVHDFPKDKLDSGEKRIVEMEAFKHKQWTTFDHSSLQIMVGKLDGPVEFDDEQWEKLEEFLAAAIKIPKPTPSCCERFRRGCKNFGNWCKRNLCCCCGCKD